MNGGAPLGTHSAEDFLRSASQGNIPPDAIVTVAGQSLTVQDAVKVAAEIAPPLRPRRASAAQRQELGGTAAETPEAIEAARKARK